MKKLISSPIWYLSLLTILGTYIAGLSLILSAFAYPKLSAIDLLQSYVLENWRIYLVNAIFPIFLVYLGYFLTRRGWAGYLLGAGFSLLIGFVNYYKISLRSDPLLASDLLLVAEAGDIMGQYQFDFTLEVVLVLFAFLIGLAVSVFLIPRSTLDLATGIFGTLSCVALILVSMVSIFLNGSYESKLVNNRFINQWSDTEVFVSRGVVYSFLNSIRDMLPQQPEGYDHNTAQQLLNAWKDEDIPEEKKVSVMGIMLEAFCDLTDFEVLAAEPGVAEVYAPWHALESNSISGNLLTNIFAGGTVDSEWGFLTGYTAHDDFRHTTDSYVWYLKEQGYQTMYSHPGYGWFYNRQNVNEYLGFDQSWFTENYYGELVNPVAAVWNSDHILLPEILKQLQDRVKDGPCFSFAVTYQNHGPYESAGNSGESYITGLDMESNNIFNNYLHGIKKTLTAITELTNGLEAMEEPVVLVLFGDHKPWAGNGNSAYVAAGANFNIGLMEGMYDYYATPYVIWANSAARATLENEFVGEGGDFSPCFLMTEVFDQCGWEGSGFMRMSREIRAVSPLIHERELYLLNGVLTDTLPQLEQEKLTAFLSAQYDREHEL